MMKALDSWKYVAENGLYTRPDALQAITTNIDVIGRNLHDIAEYQLAYGERNLNVQQIQRSLSREIGRIECFDPGN